MHPAIDIQGKWHPDARHDRSLPPDWAGGFNARMIRAAPVWCLYNLAGQNRLTFACSDAIHPVDLRAGLHEETGQFKCELGLCHHPHRHVTEYRAELLIDARDVPYTRSLDDVRRWWEDDCGYAPLTAPAVARKPFYSTWYSFHQQLNPERLMTQCRLARALGCEAVIVDDGWQTTDDNRGYAYCGDWQPVRLPQLNALIEQVHAIDMKFLLWYSTPLIGQHSEAFKRFDGRYLEFIESAGAAVADPRFPDVRQYLIETFTTAVRDRRLDGLKLDFVDFFDHFKATPFRNGMDYELVAEATERLLNDLTTMLREINPDILIEFRQPYTGPVMRQFANMLRSYDCPADAITNRVNTIDLRLLVGDTAVHSDMFMWHKDEPVEIAALQLLNVLFSVPQVSVMIDALEPPYLEMIRFWLTFWREHSDVLLDGELLPLHPEGLYPIIQACTKKKCVIACYADQVVPMPAELPGDVFLINASSQDRLILEMSADLGDVRVETFNCRGWQQHRGTQTLAKGIARIDIPRSGLAHLRVKP